jgi:DNA-binding NarL/FixJ family response regulator
MPGILLVDEQALFRDCLAALLRRDRPEWRIVGALSGAIDLEQAVRQMRPDVLILDLLNAGGAGFDSLRRIAAMAPVVRVLVLSEYRGADLVRKCRRAGVRGYVLKSDSPATLLEALDALLQDRRFFSESCFSPGPLAQDPAAGSPKRPARLRLTSREFQVFRELSLGLPNKVIAGNLGMSIRTVEAHRAKIHSKLGIGSLSALVTIAIREKVA